ncbi:hypothetical protein RM844_16930 [Streptomyces sp. DSM 44915]|uniref:Holliday junction resolvase n=1 Tax=Streptomyces chisholmiae TaxID=3075540 RepID=A0ABU2JT81_9ACTN|nr:hypothetical protein [Streptomyces sp. DSM 44915]MDT0267966.1 hypothetical protein [Streptomyces sp. DSM 44915]
MVNRNKAKGTAWESDVRDYLNAALGLVDDNGKFRDPYSALNVRRPAQEGAADVGDIHCVPFVLECKDVARPSVPSFLRQAHIEAHHAGFPYGVAVVKRRRANVRHGAVHFSVRTWTGIRLTLGITTKGMLASYQFALSARGRDTGRWYFTTDLEDFARLVADVRAAHWRIKGGNPSGSGRVGNAVR